MQRLIQIFTKNKNKPFIIGIVGIFVNILLFQSINSIMLIPFLFYWIFLGIFYRLDEKYFFKLALFFLVLSIFPLIQKDLVLAEKFSVWEYLFLILGLWQWVFLQMTFFHKKK